MTNRNVPLPLTPAEEEGRSHPTRGSGGLLLLLVAFAFTVMADPISSVAYAIEAALRALGGNLSLLVPTMALVVVVIGIVTLNYHQLVARFPDGGGAAAATGVAFGEAWAFLPIGALVVDFVLTIAISVAAGSSAIVAYFPLLAPIRMLVALGLLLLVAGLTWFGHGGRTVFAALTQAFVGTAIALLVSGVPHGGPIGLTPQGHLSSGGASWLAVGLAFPVAMALATGVEAPSSAIAQLGQLNQHGRRRVSGVLAVLSAGLYLSRRSPRFFSSTTRLEANAVWNVLVFVLNGLLFLLIGLQLRHLLGTLGDRPLVTVIGEVALISLAVIVLRLVWVFPATYLPRWLLPRLCARDPYPGWRNVLIVAWTGLRGGISLAAALALPLSIQAGQPFPERDLLIALTFGVILVTLVGQGLSLIPLIGWLGVPAEGTQEQERELARKTAAHAAVAHLQDLAGQEWVPERLLMDLRALYEEKARHAAEHLDGNLPPHEEEMASHRRLHREVLQAERAAVVRLRDQGKIDDEVLREMERELDLEEQRFRAEG